MAVIYNDRNRRFNEQLRPAPASFSDVQRQALNTTLAANAGQVYTALDPTNDIIPDQQEIISQTVWSDGTSRLTSFFTSSANSSSNGEWYYDVYDGDPGVTTSAVQFSVAYGDRLGSGSLNISTDSGISGQTPSKAVYSQYRNILLAPNDESFTLGDGVSTDQIIAINFSRARYKERLDPGNFEFWLSGSLDDSSENVFVDDSTSVTNPTLGRGGKVFNIVSGSISDGVYNSTSPTYVGLAYPDSGILILDAAKVSSSFDVDCAKRNDNTSDQNHYSFIQAVSRSTAASSAKGPSVRNQQTVTSTFYFVRVRNQNYNFTNNPTFVTGSVGDLKHSAMVNNPTVYISTIGLYNNSGECLAIASLSKPLQKTFFNELLIKVKLTY